MRSLYLLAKHMGYDALASTWRYIRRNAYIEGMDIWFVTNGYQGNGYVTVIVEAPSEFVALVKGTAALRDSCDTRLHKLEDWLREVRAEKISLPYVTEVG